MDETATITSLGAYLPPRVMHNTDFEKIVDTSDEWIFTRTGIKERRIAGDDEFSSSMGAKAARIAIEKAGISPDAIDAVIVSSMTPDYISPNIGSIIAHEVGASRACAFDLEAACTGFLYGLSIAKAWIESKTYSTILLIASEKNSAFIDFTDRATCVLFGDGAGAAIIQRGGSGYAIGQCVLGSDGSLADLITIPAGGSRNPASQKTVDDHQHFMKMNGKEVFRHAVRRMESAIVECLEKNKIAEKDLTYLVPHQANIRIIEALAKRFDMPWERVYRTIHKYGNTSSSTLPIALSELETNIGDTVALVAFGAGLTWGASLLTKV